jgi:DNA-binding LacI/PurR family transcriptional regulator
VGKSKKRTTIKDIAGYTGVSFQSVSKILRGVETFAPETVERVKEAANFLEYVPNVQARNLQSRQSHLLCYSFSIQPLYVYSFDHNGILERLLTELNIYSEMKGYHILGSPNRVDDLISDRFSNLIVSNQVDGFIVTGLEYEDQRINYLQNKRFPFVCFGHTGKHGVPPYSFVDVDGYDGLYQMTEHVISRGHSTVACVTWPEDSRLGEERLAGYRSALRANLPAGYREFVLRSKDAAAGDLMNTVTELMTGKGPKPSAFVCVSDLFAINVINALSLLGINVGSDVAVTGFDNTPLSQYLHPSLTTVAQPLKAAAKQLVDLLVETIEHPEDPIKQIILKPELMIRASS